MSQKLPPHALDDRFFFDRIKQIVSERNIQCVVETGIAEGYSSLKFSQIVSQYVGIDIDAARVEHVEKLLENTGSRVLCGDSPTVLRSIMPTLDVDHTLFFFDAHLAIRQKPDRRSLSN
jgi:predicted O-methyltransferase YrrM